MASVLTLDMLQLIENKLGKEDAKKVAEAIELAFTAIEKKAEAVALEKKLEIKDELTKELVTKAEFFGEMKLIRQEMQTLRQEMQTVKVELDRKLTIMFVVLFFTIVFLNQNALEFLARILGLLK